MCSQTIAQDAPEHTGKEGLDGPIAHLGYYLPLDNRFANALESME
jgi:hypothetical protein